MQLAPTDSCGWRRHPHSHGKHWLHRYTGCCHAPAPSHEPHQTLCKLQKPLENKSRGKGSAISVGCAALPAVRGRVGVGVASGYSAPGGVGGGGWWVRRARVSQTRAGGKQRT